MTGPLFPPSPRPHPTHFVLKTAAKFLLCSNPKCFPTSFRVEARVLTLVCTLLCGTRPSYCPDFRSYLSSHGFLSPSHNQNHAVPQTAHTGSSRRAFALAGSLCLECPSPRHTHGGSLTSSELCSKVTESGRLPNYPLKNSAHNLPATLHPLTQLPALTVLNTCGRL